MPERDTNRLRIAGVLIESEPLRHTPAGVPVVSFRLQHRSQQSEAGSQRQVECEVDAVALGPCATWIAACGPGQRFEAEGFLAARSQRNRRLVLHVQDIEFLKED